MQNAWQNKKRVLHLRRNQPKGRINVGKDHVAQLVEHLTFNQRVLGSNPSVVTKKNENCCKSLTFNGFFLCPKRFYTEGSSKFKKNESSDNIKLLGTR